MQGSIQREKISPTYSSKKGRHPTQGAYENSKYYWRELIFNDGITQGKQMFKKHKKYTRKSIKFYIEDSEFLHESFLETV